jgi:hypothetical protein
MKDYLEKLLLYVVPFLIITSICYSNGYWSLYPINIYDYYQPTDILKAVALPTFNFISIALLPLTIALCITVVSIRIKSSVTKPALTREEKDAAALLIINNNALYRALDKIKLFNNKYFLIIFFLVFLIIFTYAGGKAIISLWEASLGLSPYFDDKDFMNYYLMILDKGTLRSIQALGIIPSLIAIGAIVVNANEDSFFKPLIVATKLFTISMTIMMVFTLSYNAGKIDAYKIVAGYDFYYMIDKKNEPHKYLGKLDKYFFFLDDNRAIKDKKTMSLLSSKVYYSARISIIGEDSLKAFQLYRYNTEVRTTDSAFYNNFEYRKGNINKSTK